MVDTFTCDSCGKPNVPTDDKRTLSLKSVETTGGTTSKGKPQKQTNTQAMEICPSCAVLGVVKNHILVSEDGEKERYFTWMPRKDLASIYVWGQLKDQQTATK